MISPILILRNTCFKKPEIFIYSHQYQSGYKKKIFRSNPKMKLNPSIKNAIKNSENTIAIFAYQSIGFNSKKAIHSGFLVIKQTDCIFVQIDIKQLNDKLLYHNTLSFDPFLIYV